VSLFPITTVLLELAPRDRAVTVAGRKAYAARLSAMEAKLRADGVPPARAARLAIVCVATLQGALIQARVERSDTPLISAAEELAALLEAA
jgi:TetR/AcrR family transcriptional regulator, lmrAB and yxaGH operons repressor